MAQEYNNLHIKVEGKTITIVIQDYTNTHRGPIMQINT